MIECEDCREMLGSLPGLRLRCQQAACFIRIYEDDRGWRLRPLCPYHLGQRSNGLVKPGTIVEGKTLPIKDGL